MGWGGSFTQKSCLFLPHTHTKHCWAHTRQSFFPVSPWKWWCSSQSLWAPSAPSWELSCTTFLYMVKEKVNRKRHQHNSPMSGWAEAEAAKCLCWLCATYERCFSLALLTLKACPLSRLADVPGDTSGQKVCRGWAMVRLPSWVQTWKCWKHVERERNQNTDHPSMLVRKENRAVEIFTED